MTTVPTYTGTVPNRTQTQVNFDANVQDLLDFIGGVTSGDFVPSINTVAGEVNADKLTTLGYKNDAETAAANSAASAQDSANSVTVAQSAANATEYSASTTYNYPDTVFGSNGYAYRCLGTSVIGDDPVTSTSGDWIGLSTTKLFPSIKTANFFSSMDILYQVNTTSAAITATLPAAPSIGDVHYFADYAGTFASNIFTIARNGNNIMGLAEDMTVDRNNISIALQYIDATQGWRLIQ